jgi:prepilin-type N-terminal cleavage/methylation domain-containing protein
MKYAMPLAQQEAKRGFSLVEVVIALGIITVGIVAVLGVFPTALQSGHSAQDETRAAHIAQSIFGSIVASAPSHFTNAQLPLYPSSSPAPTPLSLNLTSNSGTTPVLTLYADNDGNLLPNLTSATYAIFVYTNNVVAGFTDPASANAVTVRVAWPATATAANQTFRDYVRIVSKF